MKTTIGLFIALLSLGLASCGKSSSSHQSQGDSIGVALAADYYTCPMHPQVKSDNPGICPICHMDLVKASNSRQSDSSMDDGMVSLTDRDQILANVSTVEVGYESLEHTVRAFGILEIPEPNKVSIAARFNGRIEKLYVNAVGTKVAKGDPLFDIYSPDLIQAQTEYRQVLVSADPNRFQMLETSKSKLLLLGLSDDQIRSLESNTTVPLVATYRSPAAGFVIEKKVVEGIYVTEGMPLYEIADLTTLWNIADVYESDAVDLKAVADARISSPSVTGRTFSATIGIVYPVVSPQTRTVKVRLVVNNSSGILRPNMYTETLFRHKKANILTVPVGAVLMTGKRNLVYVRAGQDNYFEAREIGIGIKAHGKYEVSWGLEEGEEVVSQGGYLIDSESQLKTGAGSGHQHGASEPDPGEKTSEKKHDH